MTKPTTEMTVERFQALIEAYGADPARWPADKGAAMARFANQSAAAKALLKEAAALDAALSFYAVPEPSAALTERLLGDSAAALLRGAQASAPLVKTRADWLQWLTAAASRWAPASALAGAAALGMVVGVQLNTSAIGDATVYALADQATINLPDAQDLADIP